MKYAEFDTQNSTMILEDGTLGPPMIAKLSAMATLAITSFFLGILPIKLASCLRWKATPQIHHGHGGQQPLAISLLLCFGGGVLLYTTFMHLQPEVREGMEGIIDAGLIPKTLVDSGINLAELIFCLGFFFVYLIEELVHAILDKTRPEEDMEVLHRSISIRKKCRGGNLIPRIHLDRTQTPPSTITASTQVLIRDGLYKKNGIDPIGNMTPTIEPSETESATSTDPSTVAKSFRGLLAVVALSFHAIFEGLAVGLEKEAANVWYMCAAIATHKLVIAFCIGVELVSSRTRTALVVLYMATLALVTPIGIGIGLLLTNNDGVTESPAITISSVCLQGVASGTLLYVVFFEVLQREKSHARYGFVQLLSIIAGFMVMVSLALFIGHEHHHHDHHHHHHHEHDEIAELIDHET